MTDAQQSKYRSWVLNRLQPDLKAAEERIKNKENDLKELQLVEEYVNFQHTMWQDQKLIDIGEGILATAVVDKNSKIFLNVGLGFCCECSMQEAEIIISLLKHKLQEQLDKLRNKAIHIKAHIEIAQEALNVLQQQ